MNKLCSSFLLGMSFVSAVSVAVGITGYFLEKRKTEKAKQATYQTFKDVYEDNAPRESEDDELDSIEEAFEKWY